MLSNVVASANVQAHLLNITDRWTSSEAAHLVFPQLMVVRKPVEKHDGRPGANISHTVTDPADAQLLDLCAAQLPALVEQSHDSAVRHAMPCRTRLPPGLVSMLQHKDHRIEAVYLAMIAMSTAKTGGQSLDWS